MRLETVGAGGMRLVLGKHSGRRAFRAHLVEMGFTLAPDAFERVFARFKELADGRKMVSRADLFSLAVAEVGSGERAIVGTGEEAEDAVAWSSIRSMKR
jgi:2-isopropylmalate synthase